MRWQEIKELMETSSAGGTSAGNIAVVPGNGNSSKGSIGAGFDPNGDFGIYPKPSLKKKQSQKTFIQRSPNNK